MICATVSKRAPDVTSSMYYRVPSDMYHFNVCDLISIHLRYSSCRRLKLFDKRIIIRARENNRPDCPQTFWDIEPSVLYIDRFIEMDKVYDKGKCLMLLEIIKNIIHGDVKLDVDVYAP